jgi:hypothetical protein
MTTISSLAPLRVVSRKMHGTVGNFNIDLPLSGTRGIECRAAGHLPNGATGDHQLVFTFATELTSVAGAAVTSHNPANATGSVLSSMIDSTDRHNYVLNLTNVSNAQYLIVTLNGVVIPNATGNVVGPQMGVLVGDIDASGRVDSTDVFRVRQNSLQNPNASTFRSDADARGRIDSTDVFVTRQQSLTALPSPP